MHTTFDFDRFLEDARDTVRRVNLDDHFVRRRDISTYYWNNASDLHAGALVVWNAYRGDTNAPTPEQLGLGRGFSFGASLGPVFALLAGLSLELCLKAIAKILDRPVLDTHNLDTLAAHIGISVSADEKALLDILTEHVYWRSRYPVPKKESQWKAALGIFNKAWHRKQGSLFSICHEKRIVNLENYQLLWERFESAYFRAREIVHES